jgi:capsular polysaccharide biosynthesis protein
MKEARPQVKKLFAYSRLFSLIPGYSRLFSRKGGKILADAEAPKTFALPTFNSARDATVVTAGIGRLKFCYTIGGELEQWFAALAPGTNRLMKSRKIFVAVAAVVFLVVLGLSVAAVLVMPKTYAAAARVSFKGLSEPGDAIGALQNQINLIQSEAVLNQVVESLRLNETWGRKLRVDSVLKTWESVSLLKQRMEVLPIPEASAAEIRVYDDNDEEAARIANALAETFCALPSSSANGLHSEIVSRARPTGRPFRPNVPVDIGLGAIAGVVLALLIGGVASWFASLLEKAPAKGLEGAH